MRRGIGGELREPDDVAQQDGDGVEGLRRGDLAPLQLVDDGPGQEGGEQLLRLLLFALVVGHPLVVDLGVLGGQSSWKISAWIRTWN